MNRYNIMLLASTFTCGLLYAGEAPTDVVQEAKEVAAVIVAAPKSPSRPIGLKTQESPKRPNSWTCPCPSFEPRQGHLRTSSVSSKDEQRPYEADFPGVHYLAR